MAAPPLRWGILGTGWIADRFARAVTASTRQQVYAVGSRSRSTASDFAGRHGIPVAHPSYDELVADPAVDVVYVATPHPAHHPHARLSLEAGKATVVEKPLALDAAQGADLAALAAARGVFLMEALWTLFLPKYDVIRRLVEDGALGTLHAVVADIGEPFGADHRIMRADLGGGPLYDLATYPLMLTTWLLGPPAEVVALAASAPATLSPSGVDGHTAAILRTPSGAVATVHATVLGATPTTATVVGANGSLVMDGPFYQPGGFTVTARDGRILRYDEPAVAHAALFWEAAEVARRVTAGELVSPLRTPDDSIVTLAAMDAVRAATGGRA